MSQQLQGEINVEAVMAEQARISRWRERQRRDAEWEALKQWWGAARQLRRAQTGPDREAALAGLRQVAQLYRAELGRAWPKWQRARARRWGGVGYDGHDYASGYAGG